MLNRRFSASPKQYQSPSRIERQPELNDESVHNPYDPATNSSVSPPHRHSSTKKLLHVHDGTSDFTPPFIVRQRSVVGRQELRDGPELGEPSSAAQMRNSKEHKTTGLDMSTPRPGLGPRPVGGQMKLGTFSGVFVPTCLNVLSIVMFPRFGFILGQGGVLGMMGMLVVLYLINLVTTFSLSAIATNGTVRGGGAYYLISRSLGPEFGGSIGVVFYLGLVLNTSLNAVGLIDCLRQNFGTITGNWYPVVPEEDWWPYLWATIVLLVCTGICLAGSALFARASIGLLAILLMATFSIPFSALVLQPFESRKMGIEYTGLSAATFMGNFIPHFTKGAAGSQLLGKENFRDLFGILFLATGGIFAGASMSGNLKHPSKATPKGTLYSLALTFISYTFVILAMAATITRASLHRNVNVIQDTNISGILILAGEFASTFFSTLMSVIGSAKLLQALARDKLLPGLSIFGQGRKKDDEPIYAIIITYVVAQVVMLADITKIASFITMTYLMTFLFMNLATFLLKIGSAPNFRPSFKLFNWQTALAGTIVSGAAMFFVDGVYATGCVAIHIVIFLLIHYTTPPRSWGDVSQSLIYHQVRKYLLHLRQEHVKFWRPHLLLFVNDPRRQYKLNRFCNSMKNGALYILGHVIVSQNFGDSVLEARRQQANWSKLIDFSRIKAFVNIAISPGFEWGARNIVLSAGLGGMRPNIAVLGFYNMNDLRRNQPLVDTAVPQHAAGVPGAPEVEGQLPTDTCKTETMMSAMSYVTILEDLLLKLQINVAVARGFQELVFPNQNDKAGHAKKYIDLWPIQMSAEIASESDHKANVLTTNFNTHTLILQLGYILHTVPERKQAYTLRVFFFVEYESDVEEERGRAREFLQKLRIPAEVLVLWLTSGHLPTYEVIINGQNPGLDAEKEVEECLKNQDWWEEIQKMRGKQREDAGSNDDGSSNKDVFESDESDDTSQGRQSTAREGDIDEYESDSSPRLSTPTKITRRSHGDSLRGPPPPKSVGQKEPKIPVPPRNLPDAAPSIKVSASDNSNAAKTADPCPRPQSSESIASNTASISSTSNKLISNSECQLRSNEAPLSSRDIAPQGVDEPFSALKNQARPATPPQRPAISRHSSMPKFSSKPVPITIVTTEDEPGPSIMFSDTPSPPPRHSRIPSTYRPRDGRSSFPDHISEASEGEHHQSNPPTLSRRSSSYSTQASPLSFNDLPCRAQHLILNELIRQHSDDTAVMFTTLPSPVAGTSKSEGASVAYLSDLEVLCYGCPPCLLVHSNSMTVTISL